MKALFENKMPIDWENNKYDRLLGDLQAVILKHHGRDHAYHIFLKFPKDENKIEEIKCWFDGFCQGITSAKEQLLKSKAYRLSLRNGVEPDDGGPVTGFYLSYSGYKALGVQKYAPKDPAFKKGMAGRHKELNDQPKTWEKGFEDADAMILIADDNIKRLRGLRDKTIHFFAPLKAIVNIQKGERLLNSEGDDIEHFGYRDGISQPLFLRDQVNRKSREKFDPSAPLDKILVEDKGGKYKTSFGSYLVFRKLEQNVKLFKELEEELDNLLESEDEIAGGLAVGRFEDGTPVTELSGPDLNELVDNDFNYEDDKEGSKCPFHAHIRKVNPRNEDKVIIARRGIPYDDHGRNNTLSILPEDGVGLLFLCFQSSIVDQFEKMQQMANDTTNGIDPIIGQGESKPSNWPLKWGKKKVGSFDFGQKHVTMKGGEYFFAPSISFLQSLIERD